MIGWKDIPPGMVILEPGSALKFKTGSWRAFKPRWIEENCIQCLLCWLYCPDNAVKVKDGKRQDFDFEYCALECPGKKGNKAIVMEEEVK